MSADRPQRLFTLASGGYVLLAAVVLTLAGTAWNLAPLWDAGRVRPRGGGSDPAAYGFALTPSLVPQGAIVASGMAVDALPALTDPRTIPASEAAKDRYLVPDDKVIGVVVEGEARAYPLRVLVWHEVVNDVVGGTPLAVTFNPLTHGIAVFDRRVDGRTLTFGVSGLLYQSGLVMYDKQPGGARESLWSQLQARAIAGPQAAAGHVLTILPVALARWDDWSRAWPSTRVLAPIEGEEDKYAQDVYGSYLNTDTLRFPVDPLPPSGELGLKTPVFVDLSDSPPAIVPLQVKPGERRLEVVGPSGARPVPGLYAFWFAWYATRPAR